MKDQIDANMQGVMIKTVRQARNCKAPSTVLLFGSFVQNEFMSQDVRIQGWMYEGIKKIKTCSKEIRLQFYARWIMRYMFICSY